MRPFLLPFLLALPFTRAIDCPEGYGYQNGWCLFDSWGKGPRFLAYNDCAKTGGVMFDIINAFDNTNVQQMTPSRNDVWLGLTCTSNLKTSCIWDSGRQINSSSYVNFIGGAPNADIGACVYMKGTTGVWYSSDCTQTSLQYRCMYLPQTKIPSCVDGSLYFRGKCYYGLMEYNKTDASHYCNIECAYLASIHSTGVNSIVRDVARLEEFSPYTFLGLNSSSNSWDDGTTYDYNNYGFRDSTLGDCVLMELNDAELKAGQWVSAPCHSGAPLFNVCVKDVVNSCDKVPSTVLPPNECGSAYFTSGTAGTIFSPNYPTRSTPNSCEYIISTPNQMGTILFTDLSLDSTSHIWLYSSFSSAPFAHLTNQNGTTQTYKSSTDFMKVVFNTTGGPHNYFRGEYGELRDVFAGTRIDFYGEGKLTSSDRKSEDNSWNYVLHSNKNRILITFQHLKSSYPVDVTDFNGKDLASLVSQEYTNYTVSTYSNTAWITFNAYATTEKPGFTAEFFSIY